MMRRTQVAFVVALCLLVSPFTCYGKTPTKSIVLLVDLSGSTKSQGLRDEFLKAFVNKIFPALGYGDHLVIDRIGERSLAESTTPVDVEFPEYSIFANRAKLKRRFRAMQKYVLSKFKDLLNEEAKETDILSSLYIARRAFENYPKDRKILVLMSDMIEETSILNLKKNPPDERRTDLFIERQRKKNQLPDLTGVTVYVVGATARNQDIYYKIQSFWFKYFSACGANLEPRHYGRSLLRFE